MKTFFESNKLKFTNWYFSSLKGIHITFSASFLVIVDL